MGTAICTLWVLLSGTAADKPEGILAIVKESRTAVQDDPQRQGLERVERRLEMGNLGFRYVQLVDPKQADRPVSQRYGDYLLACEFPRGMWNWDLEYFLEVSVARPKGAPLCANRARLQEGMYVLEEGDRAVADLVWPLPPPEGAAASQPVGRVSVRVVKSAAEARWFYLEVLVEDEPQTRLVQVRLHSYPFTTAGPPERQRWASTLAGAYLLTDAYRALEPATEWALVLHNRNAHEEGGCLVVFDPDEVAQASVGGTYGVGLNLALKPGRSSLHAALGYFDQQPYGRAVEALRREAETVRTRLRQVPWRMQAAPAGWQRHRAEIERLLAHKAIQARFGPVWAQRRAEIERALAEAAAGAAAHRAAERRFASLVAQLGSFKDQLYEAAIQALIEETAE